MVLLNLHINVLKSLNPCLSNCVNVSIQMKISVSFELFLKVSHLDVFFESYPVYVVKMSLLLQDFNVLVHLIFELVAY